MKATTPAIVLTVPNTTKKVSPAQTPKLKPKPVENMIPTSSIKIQTRIKTRKIKIDEEGKTKM